MVNYPGDALKTGAKELLKTGLFTDFTIKAGDLEFKVHKAILYPQSTYFRKFLGGQFQEATENASEITLPEDENVIKALVHYLYYFAWDESAAGSTPTAVFAVQVYQVADKYDIPSLSALAATRFASACDPIADPTSFVEAIYAVDECCNPKDRTLWDNAIPLIVRHMTHLLKYEEFRTMIKEKEDLNFLLLGQLYGGPSADASVAGGGRMRGRVDRRYINRM